MKKRERKKSVYRETEKCKLERDWESETKRCKLERDWERDRKRWEGEIEIKIIRKRERDFFWMVFAYILHLPTFLDSHHFFFFVENDFIFLS